MCLADPQVDPHPVVFHTQTPAKLCGVSNLYRIFGVVDDKDRVDLLPDTGNDGFKQRQPGVVRDDRRAGATIGGRRGVRGDVWPH